MYKEYKINFLTSSYALGAVLGIPFFIFGVYALYAMIQAHAPFILICLGGALMLVVFFILFLCLFYFNKLKVYVDDENVIFKMPDKTTKFKTSDIYKIEKSFSYAGKGYYVFYYDANHKKRHVIFDNNLQGYEELAEYLEKKSSKKSRWEGTLDVENEKRPIIKGLKIIYNIIITLLIIGLVVVYPFMASSNREKERQQHLPERSLWP